MNDNMLKKQGDAAVCGISGFVLKMIAVITMLIDHTAATILERGLMGELSINFITEQNRLIWMGVYSIMRVIGRMAFPIYCFLLVEGFTYTRNRGKYALRLFLFAFISEVPFDLAFNNDELENYILNFDEAEYERKCDEYLKTIGYFDDGHAAEAVVDVILQKAGLTSQE